VTMSDTNTDAMSLNIPSDPNKQIAYMEERIPQIEEMRDVLKKNKMDVTDVDVALTQLKNLVRTIKTAMELRNK
jgi:hypothetical protein